MYPPSEESEESRIARNQAEGKWVFPFFSLLTGLLGIILGAEPTGMVWTGSGAIMITDLLLEKQGISKKRRLAIRIVGGTVICGGIIWYLGHRR